VLPPCNDAVKLDIVVDDVVDGVLEDGDCFEVEDETRNTGDDTDKVVSVGSVVKAAELSRDVCEVTDVVLVTGDESDVAADDRDDDDDDVVVVKVSDDFSVAVVDRSDDVDIVELREVVDDVGEVGLSDKNVVGLEIDTEDDVDAVDREEVTELVEMAVKRCDEVNVPVDVSEDIDVVKVDFGDEDDTKLVLVVDESPTQEIATSSWCPQSRTPHPLCEHSPMCLSVPVQRISSNQICRFPMP